MDTFIVLLNLVITGMLYGMGLVLGAFVAIVFLCVMLLGLGWCIDTLLDGWKKWCDDADA